MKVICGILMVVAGMLLGLYVGGWVCFIGGIAGLITEVRADHVDAMRIAINIGKIFLAGLAGWLSALILIVPGAALVNWD